MQISQEDYQNIWQQPASQCVFCTPNPSLTILSSEHFSVIHDISPLIEGHLIIHSKEHFGCAGEVPEEYVAELLAVKEKISTLLSNVYGTVSFYEHGRAGHCLTDGPENRLCHHFHLHALPLDIDISSTIDKSYTHIILKNFTDITLAFDTYGQYLYFENTEGDKYFYSINEEIQTHYLRTVIAESIGFPERANWKQYSDYFMHIRAKRKVSRALGAMTRQLSV